MPSPRTETPGWSAAAAPKRSSRSRLSIAVAGLIVAIVVAATVSVDALHRRAVDARSANTELTEVRIEIGQLDALAWQNLALAAPDFTIQTNVRHFSRELRGDVRLLEGKLPLDSSRSIAVAVEVYLDGIAESQRLIAEHHIGIASAVTNGRISGTSQVLGGEFERDAALLQARAARADARAYNGTRWILVLGALAVLILLGTIVLALRSGERRRRETGALGEQRFRSLVQKASEVVAVVDDELILRYVTDSVERLLGRPASELIGLPVAALVDPSDRVALREVLAGVASGERGEGRLSQWSVPTHDGRTVRIEAAATDLRDDPTVGGIVLNLRDVSERHEMERQLRHQAFHDSLTGLANRALFEDRAAHALARHRRQGTGLALLLVDLDDFKALNDQHGHEAGDSILCQVAAALDDSRRASDTAARLGGDEFAMLLEEVSDAAEVEAIAQRIADRIEATSAEGRRVGVSIGGVLATDGTDSTDDLLRDADIALYAAKRSGKNRAELFSGDLLEAARRELRLRHDLVDVAARGELELHYQPLLALENGRLTELEALVRWRHPELGLVPPGDFIALAEETGQILDIGSWVLRQACTDLSRWLADGLHSGLTVAINVSAHQFAQPGFVDQVLAVLHEHELVAEHLVIELTESALVQDVDAARPLIAALREAGVRVAVDDFGTGYSSLSYLRDMQLDAVKVDRSFIEHVDERPQDATLVRSIIELGHALDLRMVAEGVERTTQLDFLRTTGCDVVQGYLFARPADEATTRRLLEAGEHAGAVVAVLADAA